MNKCNFKNYFTNPHFDLSQIPTLDFINSSFFSFNQWDPINPNTMAMGAGLSTSTQITFT